jgi:hypothetical protein
MVGAFLASADLLRQLQTPQPRDQTFRTINARRLDADMIETSRTVLPATAAFALGQLSLSGTVIEANGATPLHLGSAAFARAER